ncbi:MAG: squalene/phytoene synthase family protein [Magnetococcales bacterium]|nr:squalene/phytoene synthase family protein [Magnetococcales bacterium]
MTPECYCRERTRRARSSFFWPMRLMARPRRRAMYALYAYCRELDDIADGGLNPEVARSKLAWWRGEMASTLAGEPHHPVAVELLAAVRCFDLPREPFFLLIEGMSRDLEGAGIADIKALESYARQVAVTVGEVALRIFSDTSSGGEWRERFAWHLGLALQYTNILRDGAEDAARGRLYLPESWLAEAGLSRETLLLDGGGAAGRPLWERLYREAAGHFEAAWQAVAPADRRGVVFALAMGEIYRLLLERLRAAGWPWGGQRVRVGTWRRLWITASLWWRYSRNLRS